MCFLDTLYIQLITFECCSILFNFFEVANSCAVSSITFVQSLTTDLSTSQFSLPLDLEALKNILRKYLKNWPPELVELVILAILYGCIKALKRLTELLILYFGAAHAGRILFELWLFETEFQLFGIWRAKIYMEQIGKILGKLLNRVVYAVQKRYHPVYAPKNYKPYKPYNSKNYFVIFTPTFFELNSNILAGLILFMFFGLFILIVTPFHKSKLIKLYSFLFSLLSLFAGLFLCLFFNKAQAGFQFLFNFPSLSLYNIELSFGIDGIAIIFLLLTLFTFPLCFLASWRVEKLTKHFFVYLFSMELLLVLTFTTTDLLYFYVFFESLLIPMFIMIGVWGARERKIKAAYFFFLYTLFGSLFMLFGILYLYFLVGSTNYFVLLNSVLTFEQQKLVWLCFFVAFSVKIPLFPFHIWLPEAHVEAPTVGSMLLASLLLKLGGYGFLRFSLTMLHDASVYYAPLVSVCALLGVIYGSFSTIRQVDLKRIIAYSSVAHMNLVVLGLFSFSSQGIEGALFLMVGHGVVSAALFFCVGVLYDRYHSRLIRYYGGLVTVMPLFSTFFFFFTLANMSFPGTSNFLGELLIFTGLFYKNSAVLLLSTISIVLSAVYSTWLYNRIVFGVLKTAYISRFSDLTRREAFILFSFLLPMIFLGLNANFILDFARLPVEIILL